MFRIKILYLFSILLLSTTLFSKEVKLQLLWKHQFEFAGFYIAKEKGFYHNEGLEVKILEYKNGIHVAEDVAKGKVDFGVIYSDILLNENELNNIVILSALLQSSPHVLVSLKSSGIQSISDFPHKKIMISEDAKRSAAFIAMLKLYGVSLKDMITLKPTFDINSLLKGKTDITTAYRSNELYILDKRKIPYMVWDPKDYGFDLYSDLLITSKNFLRHDPDIVEKFRRATLKGYDYAFSHINETVDIILKKYNTLHKSREALIYEANVLKKLAYHDNVPLGTVEKERIQRILDIYRLIGLTKTNLNVDSLIYSPPSSSIQDSTIGTSKHRWWISGLIILILIALSWKIWSNYYKKSCALKIYAFKDPLTGLYNRRYLDVNGRKLFLYSKQEKKPLSIMMIDIDDFKQINDRYGHLMGDKVLQALSKILLEETRKSDIVGRYGGEEFIVLLPHTTAQGAMTLAKKIQNRLKNISIKSERKLSVSIGITELDFVHDLSLENLISRADRALYWVKNNGKNSVAVEKN